MHLLTHAFIRLSTLQAKSKQLQKEGWEYSTVFTTRFHSTNRKMDLVRRRRWHRKMTQIVPSAPAVFHISSPEVSLHHILTKIINPKVKNVYCNVYPPLITYSQAD